MAIGARLVVAVIVAAIWPVMTDATTDSIVDYLNDVSVCTADHLELHFEAARRPQDDEPVLDVAIDSDAERRVDLPVPVLVPLKRESEAASLDRLYRLEHALAEVQLDFLLPEA